MEEKPRYRHELKYEIDYGTYLALSSRLGRVMKPDAHARPGSQPPNPPNNQPPPGSCYTVRSIYFDNIDDKALREKIYGFQKREKFRIRYYNDDFSFINLEKKIKHNHLCLKCSARLSARECRDILKGRLHYMIKHSDPLVQELYCRMKTQQLKPRILVSYLREPYLLQAGNVRVTFDSHIRTSLFHRKFFEEQVQDISASETPGQIIMEVKYDAFLPEIISCLLQTENIRQTAFSKYGACRRFG